MCRLGFGLRIPYQKNSETLGLSNYHTYILEAKILNISVCISILNAKAPYVYA